MKYHKIINEIKRFSELRNKLLHGHMVGCSGTDKGGKIIQSDVSEKLNLKFLKEQIERFVLIIDGINFYFSSYEGVSPEEKNRYRENYLNYTFLLDKSGEFINL